MPARLFLLLILVIHPARGVLAAEIEHRGMPADTCGAMCCPLCAELDACPCNAAPDEPRPMPEPAAPIDRTQLTPVIPGPAIATIRSESLSTGAPRAPPVFSLRAIDGDVSTFLSKVCVWTT